LLAAGQLEKVCLRTLMVAGSKDAEWLDALSSSAAEALA
jgi:hypothetical protein